MRHFSSHRSGFSLVELAVVLAVIGLLVGGVMEGKSLYQASRINKVITNLTSYATAARAFKDQYNGLPGDLPNATQYWGITAGSTGSDNTCWDATSTSGTTCNGNGNMEVQYNIGTGHFAEVNLAWQHLSNAGLVKGKFQGGSNAPVIDSTCPGSVIPNGAYSFASSNYGGSWGETFSTETNGLVLFFGKLSGSVARTPILTTVDAQNIDTKMDDGKPDTGMIVSQNDWSNCFTGTYPNASYNVGYTLPDACAIRFTVIRDYR